MVTVIIHQSLSLYSFLAIFVPVCALVSPRYWVAARGPHCSGDLPMVLPTAKALCFFHPRRSGPGEESPIRNLFIHLQDYKGKEFFSWSWTLFNLRLRTSQKPQIQQASCVTASFDTYFLTRRMRETEENISWCKMLSSRALKNVQQLERPFRFTPTPDYDPQINPQGLISFGMAENVSVPVNKSIGDCSTNHLSETNEVWNCEVYQREGNHSYFPNMPFLPWWSRGYLTYF